MTKVEQMLRDIEQEVQLTRAETGKNTLDPRVLSAMRAVPRERFVPEDERSMAYYNGPLSIGHGQTISQPYMVALMTDLLHLQPHHVILEVGTGSGYQAAVLSQLVARIYSVERIAQLAKEARARLQGLGYLNVEVVEGDGYRGLPEHAPYDGIIVTAAAPHIPQPLVDQLKPSARLVIPLGGAFAGQELVVVEKSVDGHLSERRLLSVAFVPLTGSGHNQPAQIRKPKGHKGGVNDSDV